MLVTLKWENTTFIKSWGDACLLVERAMVPGEVRCPTNHRESSTSPFSTRKVINFGFCPRRHEFGTSTCISSLSFKQTNHYPKSIPKSPTKP